MAGDIRIADAVDGDSRHPVLVAAAEIGAVHQRVARRVELADEHVGHPAAIGGLSRVGGREVGGERDADDIGVARAVDRDALAVVLLAPAQIGAVAQHRIDHQRQARVVATNREADALLVEQRVAAIDRQAFPIDVLVDHRFVLDDITRRGLEHEIALRIQVHRLDARRRELDLPGIDPRRDDEVVFQLVLVAVINDVHARIHLVVFDLAEAGRRRGASGPGRCPAGNDSDRAADRGLRRRASDWRQPGRADTIAGVTGRLSARTRRLDAASAWLTGGTQCQHRFIGRQEQAVAGAARHEPDPGVAWPWLISKAIGSSP